MPCAHLTHDQNQFIAANMNEEKKPIFQDMKTENPEILEIESLCINCGNNGKTRLLLTKIPFHKELILMSFQCGHCGFNNNETQFGGSFQEKGLVIKLHVQKEIDLNRRVIKSDFAEIAIPELDLEIPSRSQKGEVTTVEGVLERVISGLEQDQAKRREEDPETAEKITQFLTKIYKKKSLEEPFYLILKDPSGNSFIENPNAPQKDERMDVTHYKRSTSDNSRLGITDDQNEMNSSEQEATPSDELHIVTFQTNCHICNSPCETNMKPTKIPHFKEVIIMATNCEVCGHRSNEVKSGAGVEPLGRRIKLNVTSRRDLTRDVLKSETCNISIPELELEVGAGALGGRYTTVEGLIDTMQEQLKESCCTFFGDSSSAENRQKLGDFLQKMDRIKDGSSRVHLLLDDPAGNSYIQNFCPQCNDPQIEVVQYERTFEQNEELGLNDMKTENYNNQ